MPFSLARPLESVLNDRFIELKSFLSRQKYPEKLITADKGLIGGFLLLRNFSVAISVSPHVCFILVLIFDFPVSKIMHL